MSAIERLYVFEFEMEWTQDIRRHVDQDTTEKTGEQRVRSRILVVSELEEIALAWLKNHTKYIGTHGQPKSYKLLSRQPVTGLIIPSSIRDGEFAETVAAPAVEGR
jgi:hypothetical protein